MSHYIKYKNKSPYRFLLLLLQIFPMVFPGVSFPSSVYGGGCLLHSGPLDMCGGFHSNT